MKLNKISLFNILPMISLRDMKFLETACQILASDCCPTEEKKISGKNFHLAIIAMGNKIISIGKNHSRTRMKKFNYDHFECHAELDAVMRVRKKQCILWGYTLCRKSI